MSSEDPKHPGKHLSFAQARIGTDGHRTELRMANDHETICDQPTYQGGTDEGPSPLDLALAGLAACKASVLRTYATRKGWPMAGAVITTRHRRVPGQDLADGEKTTGMVDVVDCEIEIMGDDLTIEQREQLFQMADHCTVHRMLTGETRVVSRMVDPAAR